MVERRLPRFRGLIMSSSTGDSGLRGKAADLGQKNQEILFNYAGEIPGHLILNMNGYKRPCSGPASIEIVMPLNPGPV